MTRIKNLPLLNDIKYLKLVIATVLHVIILQLIFSLQTEQFL